jgi:hypothetical protein|tara:strand:+ start:1163 stop:1402 length:240 start_codon:yes stop_codon:yes gene_type:complete
MLKILRKDTDIKIQETLEEGYTDITSVCMWIGVVEKIGYDKTEAKNQIELFIKSLGENIDTHNKVWYDCYKDPSNNYLN